MRKGRSNRGRNGIIDNLTMDGNGNNFHFFARDHVGSIRKVYDKNGNVEQANDFYAYGGLTNEHTTGTDIQAHKFNGKELDKMHGLNWYDYSARQYDAIIGQFTSMDPLAEKYYSISPYAYCAGNPVKYVDPDGRKIQLPMPAPTANFFVKVGQKIAGNSNFKTAVFYLRHPSVAKAIGNATTKGTISNTASNFEINICKADPDLKHGEAGDEGNAIRHTLWQAMITNEFGRPIAERVAYCHEDNENIVNQTMGFKERDGKGDTFVDRKNNEIGRSIAESNPNSSNKELITKVMEHFQSKGLYILRKGDDGNFYPERKRITELQLQRAMQIIKQKNENGLNK